MNIYIVRHGTTEWNSLRRIQGRTDIMLDKTGIEMAKQTGIRLVEMGIKFDRVYSSPLKRAYKTAELLSFPTIDQDQGASCNLLPEIHTDIRLSELCFGDFEGKNVEDMLNDPNCAFRYFKTDPKRYNNEIKSGITVINALPETLTSLLERTSGFILDIIEPLVISGSQSLDDTHSSNKMNVLISGHGAVNKALLMYFRGISDLADFWGNGLQPNCGINKISCTRSSNGKIDFRVQEDCMVLYDRSLEKNLKKLL